MLLNRKNDRMWQHVNKVLHQVDLKHLRLVRQGETDSVIIEEVETTVRGCGVEGISRNACRGVVGQRQLTETR